VSFEGKALPGYSNGKQLGVKKHSRRNLKGGGQWRERIIAARNGNLDINKTTRTKTQKKKEKGKGGDPN